MARKTYTSFAFQFSSVQSLSCVRLCDPMNRSTPGLPVHHPLPEFTQTHVHPVSDAIQASHPVSSPSPPTPNPSQHQSCLHLLKPNLMLYKGWQTESCQIRFFPKFSSVVQSCLTLCDPMDCSTPDLPIHHQLLKLAQTHFPKFPQTEFPQIHHLLLFKMNFVI